MTGTASIDVELKMAENLKPEIRAFHKLPDQGLVIKRIIRKSPAVFEYKPVHSFSLYLKELLSKADMSDFVQQARLKI